MIFYENLCDDRDLGRITDAVQTLWGSPASGNWSSSGFTS